MRSKSRHWRGHDIKNNIFIRVLKKFGVAKGSNLRGRSALATDLVPTRACRLPMASGGRVGVSFWFMTKVGGGDGGLFWFLISREAVASPFS